MELPQAAFFHLPTIRFTPYKSHFQRIGKKPEIKDCKSLNNETSLRYAAVTKDEA